MGGVDGEAEEGGGCGFGGGGGGGHGGVVWLFVRVVRGRSGFEDGVRGLRGLRGGLVAVEVCCR